MIDILLSTYNGKKFLREQIDSLLSQTYQNFKILVRDDCSSDDTVNIIFDYINMYPSKIKLIDNNGTNLGSTNSFFELLRHSEAELIMFCDQDDVWNNNKLESFIEFYKEIDCDKEKPILIHSAAEVVDEKLCVQQEASDRFNLNKCGMEKSFVWQIFQNDVTGCTMMINSAMRDILISVDFTEHKVIQHDWFIAQIAYLCNAKFYFSQKTIMYRQHSANIIGTKKKSLKDKIILKLKKGLSYPYYGQIETLLLFNDSFSIDEKYLLKEFVSLRYKNKFLRVFWHLKHNFFRDGNLFYKLYQLLIC